jgi:hypothetical protein
MNLSLVWNDRQKFQLSFRKNFQYTTSLSFRKNFQYKPLYCHSAKISKINPSTIIPQKIPKHTPLLSFRKNFQYTPTVIPQRFREKFYAESIANSNHQALSIKSFHSGLSFSIKSIFHCRFHFFKTFSLAMASFMYWYS